MISIQSKPAVSRCLSTRARPFRRRAEDLRDYGEALLLPAATVLQRRGKERFRLEKAARVGDAVDLPGVVGGALVSHGTEGPARMHFRGGDLPRSISTPGTTLSTDSHQQTPPWRSNAPTQFTCFIDDINKIA